MEKEITLSKQIITDSLGDFYNRINNSNDEILSVQLNATPQCNYSQSQTIQKFRTKFFYSDYICIAQLSSFEATVQAYDKNNIENKLLSEDLSYRLQKSLFSNMINVYGIDFIKHLQKSWKAFFRTKFFKEDIDEIELFDLLSLQENKEREIEQLQQMLL